MSNKKQKTSTSMLDVGSDITLFNQLFDKESEGGRIAQIFYGTSNIIPIPSYSLFRYLRYSDELDQNMKSPYDFVLWAQFDGENQSIEKFFNGIKAQPNFKTCCSTCKKMMLTHEIPQNASDVVTWDFCIERKINGKKFIFHKWKILLLVCEDCALLD